MKFIITESKLTNLVFDYLDGLDLYMVEDREDYYFWESKKSWKSGEYVLISVHRSHNDGFISSNLLVEVSSFFSLELDDSLDIIGDWVRTKINTDVYKFYSDYGAD